MIGEAAVRQPDEGWPTFIKALRKRLGLSQEALAGRLFAARYSVIQWEKGRNLPDRRFQRALLALAESG